MFIGVRIRSRHVSLCSLGCALGDVGFTAESVIFELHPEGARSYPGSLRSLRCALKVIRFVRGHWGGPWVSSGSSIVVGLIGVRTGVHRVRPGSLSSLGYAQRFVGFIRGSWVN